MIDGSIGVYIGGFNGNNVNGAVCFMVIDLIIDVQGYSVMGINVQKNFVVDFGINSIIKINGDNVYGFWSFGQVSVNVFIVDVIGVAVNGVEVCGGIIIIGVDSYIFFVQGGGFVISGLDVIINFIGMAV